MTPVLANALNIPYILVFGFIILVPLMAFEVFVESAILRRAWKVSWDDLLRFTVKANIWSLIAGIPVKFLNAFIYDSKLPKDLPSFFEAYPLWITVGSVIYFIVTVTVEMLCSVTFARSSDARLTIHQRFLGILLANIATYTVLAPLHYELTKPEAAHTEFTRDSKWTAHPGTTLIYVESTNSHLVAINLDGSNARTIVPHPVRDYLVSENLDVCLYRSPEGHLRLYRASMGENKLVLETSGRFRMNEAAVSPSSSLVAFMSGDKQLMVLDTASGKNSSISLPKEDKLRVWSRSLAWSRQETNLFVYDSGTNLLSITVHQDLQLKLESMAKTNHNVFPAFGRVGDAIWDGHDDWGTSYRNDICADLKVSAVHGLGSNLRVYRENEMVYDLRVKMGALGLSTFAFGDVAFLPGCTEIVFESKGHLYLLDLHPNASAPSPPAIVSFFSATATKNVLPTEASSPANPSILRLRTPGC